jgi:YjgF/chorismate_mutase-like, putative endoribonuclease
MPGLYPLPAGLERASTLIVAGTVRKGVLCICSPQLKAAVGDLGLITRILKLHVYVASTPEFAEHHLVASGASDLLCDVLGSARPHARSAFGVANSRLTALSRSTR